MKIQDSVVVVTGANRGLGAALVKTLVELGAKRVYAGARDPAAVGGSDRVVPLALDVTSTASIDAATAKAKDATILINNAGVLASFGVLDARLPDIERDFAVNMYGVLATTRAFLPVLERARGAIVNVLSVASLASVPPLAGYSASKAAAWSLTQALRAELAPKGVSVHAALPGGIDTDMVSSLDIPKTKPSDVARGILAGLERGDFEIFPDPSSLALSEIWKTDPRGAAKQLGG
jgi:NAD(P)-dependent dehydrogenase (short-subunit alcohol dehydrogenase family)